MRYKCEYGPGEILDPEYYDWHPFNDEFRAKLDAKPYYSRSLEQRLATGEPDPKVDPEEDELMEFIRSDPGKWSESQTVFTTEMAATWYR
ncbi:hypothetical protein ABW20_dc0101032 [Dactylellina cionopaga]|nr:hypothetical protein ABW20_dc0101032 [Dactylellina cionopaga]